MTQTTWSRYSWYPRLPGGERLPWSGIVRCEASDEGKVGQFRTLADQTAAVLPVYASERHKEPQAPQNLYPTLYSSVNYAGGSVTPITSVANLDQAHGYTQAHLIRTSGVTNCFLGHDNDPAGETYCHCQSRPSALFADEAPHLKWGVRYITSTSISSRATRRFSYV